jgi:hypothetical protein
VTMKACKSWPMCFTLMLASSLHSVPFNFDCIVVHANF